MSKNKSDWNIPSDWLFHLGWFFILPLIIVLSSAMLAALSELKAANTANLFWSGFGLGCLGIVILFFARLPLYRQRQFFKFGPGTLPPFYRKLYWLAYTIVLISLLLLGAVWLQIK